MYQTLYGDMYHAYAKQFNRKEAPPEIAIAWATLEKDCVFSRSEVGNCIIDYHAAAWEGVDGYYIQVLQWVKGVGDVASYEERNVREGYITNPDQFSAEYVLVELMHYMKGENSYLQPEQIRFNNWRDYTDGVSHTF